MKTNIPVKVLNEWKYVKTNNFTLSNSLSRSQIEWDGLLDKYTIAWYSVAETHRLIWFLYYGNLIKALDSATTDNIAESYPVKKFKEKREYRWWGNGNEPTQ